MLLAFCAVIYRVVFVKANKIPNVRMPLESISSILFSRYITKRKGHFATYANMQYTLRLIRPRLTAQPARPPVHAPLPLLRAGADSGPGTHGLWPGPAHLTAIGYGPFFSNFPGALHPQSSLFLNPPPVPNTQTANQPPPPPDLQAARSGCSSSHLRLR